MNCRQLNDKWITFDCYGTLLDWQTAFRRLLGPEVVARYHELEPEIQADMPDAAYRDVLREAAVRLGLEDRDVLVTGWSSIGPFADTVAALAALRDAGWKLGILTNCDVDLFESTRAALGVPIDLVVTAEEVGGYKPSLNHFTRFEEVTGVRPGRLGARRGQLVARHGAGARARVAQRLGGPRAHGPRCFARDLPRP